MGWAAGHRSTTYDTPPWHYDHDFELIADITGQPMEWIVPAGAVP